MYQPKQAQPCNQCGCHVIWNNELLPPANTNRAKEGKKGWWQEDLSKEYHSSERCKKMYSTNEWKKETIPVTGKTDYGQMPEYFQKIKGDLKSVWHGYACIAAELVDEVQPFLDPKTRAQAVSAVTNQLIMIRQIGAIERLSAV